MSCFWEKKENRRKYHLLSTECFSPELLLVLQIPFGLAAPICKSSRPWDLSGFCCYFSGVSGTAHPFWIKAGTVELGQSTQGKDVWNNGPFLLSSTHALLTQPSELRKQKTFLPTTSSKSFSLSGLWLCCLNYKMRGIRLADLYESPFLGQQQLK